MPAKLYAVIVAGGTGSRMGNEIPKQFLNLNGKPLLLHTLKTFASVSPDIEIILVTHPQHRTVSENILSQITARTSLVEGGHTRFASVKAGLNLVSDDAIVLIHDAVRCLVSLRLINSCLENTRAHGNAIPAITPRESIRVIEKEGNKMLDRNTVRLIQTPQTFHAKQIKRAYEGAAHDSFTDDASVLEAAGIPVHLIEGEESNIKITWPIDLQVAEAILQERAPAR